MQYKPNVNYEAEVNRLFDGNMFTGELRNLIESWTQEDPVAAKRWAEGLSSRGARTLAINIVARVWAAKEPVTAKFWEDGLQK